MSEIRKTNYPLYQKAWKYVKLKKVKNYPDEKGRIRISKIDFEIARLKAKQKWGKEFTMKLEDNINE